MSRPPGDLRERFAGHLRSLTGLESGDRVVVALSGGLDSCVLLHLVRWAPGCEGVVVEAAHLDHAMRPGSEGDAAWVRGLARAWDVPLHETRLERGPGDEAAARRARYDFLDEVRERVDARWVLTAHHADDQAETVLFRVLRGTGLSGLAGIPAVREDARLVRPLLPWWREDVAAYARRHRVPARVDPSNRDAAFARNVVRQELIPRAEEAVAPGARRALVRLARLARRDAAGWERAVEDAVATVVTEDSGDRVVLSRECLLALHPTLRARVLRSLVRRLGPTLDEAGTRDALQFTSSGASGRTRTLPRGVILRRDFDTFVLTVSDGPHEETEEAGAEADDDPSDGAPRRSAIHIREAGTGEERFALGGRSWRVRWSRTGRPSGRWSERFHTAGIAFPLRVRGWDPGDRMTLPYGTKKVAKLFAEARVPAAERHRRPVVEDARGRIVWVPGVARTAESRDAPDGEPTGGREDAFTIAILDADHR